MANINCETSSEEVSKSSKQADNFNNLEYPLRICVSNIVDESVSKKNGILRMRSYGRGRQSKILSPRVHIECNSSIYLKDLILPLEKQCSVEIIELKSLSNILVRPLEITENSLRELYALLVKVNENIDQLITVDSPNIDEFYLAKWTVDDYFYRAKVLKNLENGKYEVCFVDEGTWGDIATEFKVIPDNLLDIPCQFVESTINCEESKELVDFILNEGKHKRVNIYVTTNVKVNGKTFIRIFIEDKDVIDLYKSMYKIDPRSQKIPNKNDLQRHSPKETFKNCIIKLDPNNNNQCVTVILNDTVEINPQNLEPLTSSPITNDLLVYKDIKRDSLHRCIVQDYHFRDGPLRYSVVFLDEIRSVDAVKETLLNAASIEAITLPPLVLRGLIYSDSTDPAQLEGVQSVKLSEYDSRKDLYVFEFEEQDQPTKTEFNLGETKTVIISYVESANEFYVQFTDQIAELDRIQVEINVNNSSVAHINNVKELELDQVVVGPFESINYRAIVKKIDFNRQIVLLYFMDFGNSEWTAACRIGTLSEKIAMLEPIAHRCRLSVEIRETVLEEVKDLLMTEYCDLGAGDVTMKINAVNDDGIFLVNLAANNKTTMVEILDMKGFIVPEKNSRSKAETELLLTKKLTALEDRIAKMEQLLKGK